MLSTGPTPQTHNDRLDMIEQFCERLHGLYPGEVVAIGLYGSMARRQDGPYSDIELG